MKHLFVSLFLGCFFVQLSAQSNKKTVNTLLEKTGSASGIKQFDAIFERKITESKTTFPNEADFVKFEKIMKSGFNSKDAEIYFKDYLIENSVEDSLQKVIILYDAPLVQKMTKLELKANDPANDQDKMAYFQNMQTNPPSEDRILQLVSLNNELGTSEMAIGMMKNIIYSMANGANLTQSKEQQVSMEDLKTKIESSLPENFSQQMTNQIVALSLYTYKDVDDKDLDTYIQMWGSSIGKYYMQLIFGAYDYSFSKMGEKLGESFKILEKS